MHQLIENLDREFEEKFKGMLDLVENTTCISERENIKSFLHQAIHQILSEALKQVPGEIFVEPELDLPRCDEDLFNSGHNSCAAQTKEILTKMMEGLK